MAFVRFAREASSKLDYSRPYNLKEQIKNAKKTNLKVCVIGSGISGIQTMKTMLANGVDVVCFERDKDACGFWRFKEDTEHPSVYRSIHIDSDRDQNSFGDYPWDTDKPLLIHNTEIVNYLRKQIQEFNLDKKIKFGVAVEFVTPAFRGKEHTKDEHKWEVTYFDEISNERRTEIFDGVAVCTGRHGGGGFTPDFEGLENYKGFTTHSSKYKYPAKHDLIGKNVCVVGVGNSGIDISTELVPAGCKHCYVVSRSGCYVQKMPHMEIRESRRKPDNLAAQLTSMLPWFWADDIVMGKRSGASGTPMTAPQVKDQDILNKHGLKPKHKFMQQHIIFTGFAGQKTLHDQLEDGEMSVKKGIVKFTEDGILFKDKDGNVEKEATKVDACIFATGYRQQAGFVDKNIVDMRFERKGNDVPLWKGTIPVTKYHGLSFINFVQSATFQCAEIQGRLAAAVLLYQVKLPSLEVQNKEVNDVRNSLMARYIDRSQLRVQHGIVQGFYDDIAETLGCMPSFWRLLWERPDCLSHYLFTRWQPLHYRMIGPGAFGHTKEKLDEANESRYNGIYKNEEHPLHGEEKPGDPRNLDSYETYFKHASGWARLAWQVILARMSGYSGGMKIQDHLETNKKYAIEIDLKENGIEHSLQMGAEVKDGYLDQGGKRQFVFDNRKETVPMHRSHS